MGYLEGATPFYWFYRGHPDRDEFVLMLPKRFKELTKRDAKIIWEAERLHELCYYDWRYEVDE